MLGGVVGRVRVLAVLAGLLLLALLGVVVEDGLGRLVEALEGVLEVAQESPRAVARKVVADDDAHQLELGHVRRHRVRRHDPARLAQDVGDRELVVVRGAVLEPPADERQALAAGVVADELEALAVVDGEDLLRDEVAAATSDGDTAYVAHRTVKLFITAE